MSHLEELKVLSHLPIGDFAQESIDLISLHHSEEINETIAKLLTKERILFKRIRGFPETLWHGSAPDIGGGVS